MERAANHIDLVKTYFDHHAQTWSDLYQDHKRVNDLVLVDRKDIALDFLRKHVRPGAKILDAGCGAGLIALDAVKSGFIVHGVDVSQEMVDLCETNFAKEKIESAKYTFSAGDVVTASLSDGSFEGILALGFLQYQDDQVRALKRLHDLLKPRGVLILSGPIRTKVSNFFGLPPMFRRRMRRLRRKKRRSKGRIKNLAPEAQLLRQISVHGYSLTEFRTLLKRANFKLMRYRGHGYVNFQINPKWLNFKRELFLHRAFTTLSKFLPIQRFANDMVLVARRG